jgi:hypothetical protein
MRLSIILILIHLLCFDAISQYLSYEEIDTVFVEENAQIIENEFHKVKLRVDSIYKFAKSDIEFYVQNDSGKVIKRVVNFDNISESIYSVFNIIRSRENNIIMIVENPYSISGDWNIAYISYYDNNGNIIAFVRYSNFFNGVCAEIVKEESTYFYDKEQTLVKKTYEIKDNEGNNLDYRECVFNYGYNYRIYKSLKDFFKYNVIE